MGQNLALRLYSRFDANFLCQLILAGRRWAELGRGVCADVGILVGFLGSTTAVKPNVLHKGNKTTVSINPPVGASALFLLIDREVALEFLVR